MDLEDSAYKQLPLWQSEEGGKTYLKVLRLEMPLAEDEIAVDMETVASWPRWRKGNLAVLRLVVRDYRKPQIAEMLHMTYPQVKHAIEFWLNVSGAETTPELALRASGHVRIAARAGQSRT